LDDRLAERAALARVADRCFEGAARDADGLRRDTDASAVERHHREREAAAGRAENGVVADLDAVEHELRGRRTVEAELVLEARDAEADRASRHDERRDAAMTGVRIRDRPDDHRTRVVAARDPLLRTRDAPAARRLRRDRAHRRRIAAR